MNKSQEIAARIIKLRNSVGWSQSELSRRTGVTSAAISLIEKGNRTPSLSVILKLAKAFNMPMEKLLSMDEVVLDKEVKAFFVKFGDINNLKEEDQDLILSIAKRLKDVKKKR